MKRLPVEIYLVIFCICGAIIVGFTLRAVMLTNETPTKVEIGTIHRAAVYPTVLTPKQIKEMAGKDEILEGFSVLTIAFDKMQMKAGAAWVNIGLSGKYKVVFRYGTVGFEGDKLIKGIIVDFVKIKKRRWN